MKVKIVVLARGEGTGRGGQQERMEDMKEECG
jgi:hypothetical protein